MFVDAEARALIGGETIVAFVERHSLSEGEEVPISAEMAADPSMMKPAYVRWAGAVLPEGVWVGVVEAVHPAALLDQESGGSHHIYATPGNGDLVIIRVFDEAKPVLSDETYEARVASIEGALAG